MQSSDKQQRLKKDLKLFDVYALATGTTLSAGFFLLPGIAAIQAGNAIVIAYLIAALPIIPAIFSVVELTTAMPRAGGVYYFMDRSLGPLFGTIGGIGTWLSLVLKVAFALIGIGVYVGLFLPELPIKPVAIGIAILFGFINVLGAKSSGRVQVFLVIILLAILAGVLGKGVTEISSVNFAGFFDAGFTPIVSTAAMVYISYIGVTKVASVSEEVENPERNLPLGIFLAVGTAVLVYGVGTTVMVGVVPKDELAGDLAPVATVAGILFGEYGIVLVTFAALLAFVSVANAGTMSASRYPLAMSRDLMMPGFFQRLGKSGAPFYSVAFTVGAIVVVLLLLDTTKIVKIASAFQLLMFMFVCLAVIVMRESKIDSYDPGYHSPLYPWMQIFGVFASLWLLSEMGAWTTIFTVGMVCIGVVWYCYYVRSKVGRIGAIYHYFEQLGQSRNNQLDRELRGILKEKELRKGDLFDELVARSHVIDVNDVGFEEIVERVSKLLTQYVPETYDNLRKQFYEGTIVGITPVAHGVALPHTRVEGLDRMEMVMVRSRLGVRIQFNNPATDQEEKQILYAMFFVLSPLDKPTQHLRMIAQIARHVEYEHFMADWKIAKDEQQLKEALLHNERFHSIYVHKNTPAEFLIGKPLSEVHMPEGSLVALVRRDEQIIVPRGSTVLKENDRLTVIGEPSSMKKFHKQYIG